MYDETKKVPCEKQCSWKTVDTIDCFEKLQCIKCGIVVLMNTEDTEIFELENQHNQCTVHDIKG